MINRVLCLDWLENELPDKCAKLIIMDPPYFEVKGKFDFIWKTFEDYLADVELWAQECKRVLADNGTLFWYGDRKKLAYSQVILDKHFNLEANITVEIIDKQTRKNRPEDARSFINVTERLLMYSNEVGQTGLQKIKLDINNFKPLRDYFESFQKALGMTKSAIIDYAGQQADHCFRWGSSQWELPISETYSELCALPLQHKFTHREYEDLRREYEDLRREYEDLRRYFHTPEEFKTDVLRGSQEAHLSKNHDHDTVKPLWLARVLIQSTTRPGDTVVVPMAGSGTECEVAAEKGRPFHGYDIDYGHTETANARAQKILCKPKIFYS